MATFTIADSNEYNEFVINWYADALAENELPLTAALSKVHNSEPWSFSPSYTLTTMILARIDSPDVNWRLREHNCNAYDTLARK